jgi:hypothetical protein
MLGTHAPVRQDWLQQSLWTAHGERNLPQAGVASMTFCECSPILLSRVAIGVGAPEGVTEGRILGIEDGGSDGPCDGALLGDCVRGAVGGVDKDGETGSQAGVRNMWDRSRPSDPSPVTSTTPSSVKIR